MAQATADVVSREGESSTTELGPHTLQVLETGLTFHGYSPRPYDLIHSLEQGEPSGWIPVVEQRTHRPPGCLLP